MPMGRTTRSTASAARNPSWPVCARPGRSIQPSGSKSSVVRHGSTPRRHRCASDTPCSLAPIACKARARNSDSGDEMSNDPNQINPRPDDRRLRRTIVRVGPFNLQPVDARSACERPVVVSPDRCRFHHQQKFANDRAGAGDHPAPCHFDMQATQVAQVIEEVVDNI